MSDNYWSDYSAVSRTMLNVFRKSRLEYYLTYVAEELAPPEPTQPMMLGTVLHGMLLEGRKLDELVLCYPPDCLKINGDLNGKRAAVFQAENPGRVYMKERAFENIQTGVQAVLNRLDIAEALEAATSKEKRFDAVLDGIPCKCRPDIACDLDAYIAVYDLKFSLNVDPDTWRRTSRRLALWAQDAHYSRVLSTAFNKPVQFRFINIEVKPPHRIQWYWYPPAARELAFGEHRRLLLELGRCHETGDWSDNWPSETELNPWDFQQTDDDIPQDLEAA